MIKTEFLKDNRAAFLVDTPLLLAHNQHNKVRNPVGPTSKISLPSKIFAMAKIKIKALSDTFSPWLRRIVSSGDHLSTGAF